MDLAKQNVKLPPISSLVNVVQNQILKKILLNNYKPATSKSTSKIGLKVQLFRQHLLKN